MQSNISKLIISRISLIIVCFIHAKSNQKIFYLCKSDNIVLEFSQYWLILGSSCMGSAQKIT